MEIQTEQIASRKAFENLLIANLNILKEMARRFAREQDEVEDLVQDTLLKALRFHEKFRMDTNIRGWLFTIMRNTFINSVNRISRGRDLELILEVGLKSVHSVNTVFVKLITDEVEQAICRLDPVLRQPIRLYNAGYKYREISELTDRPIGTVKTRIRTARRSLLNTFPNLAD